jgi:hypothetical protein
MNSHASKKQKRTKKNLVELDKGLTAIIKNGQSEKASVSNLSIRGSKLSNTSSIRGSTKSRHSTFAKAGLDISSSEVEANKQQYQDSQRSPRVNRTSNLNRSHVMPKNGDEWDNIIMKDVKKYEEEQKQSILQKQQLKRQTMDDLNKQINEKKRLVKREREIEIELEKKRQNVHHLQDKRATQAEVRKTWKNQEQRKVMETQIAEVENMKRFEHDKELSIAKVEKAEANKACEDEITRNMRKRRENKQEYQKQYQENIELKDHLMKQEQQRRKEDALKKVDMFGDMFEEKVHVSYEYAARNKKKVDALSKILDQENKHKNKIKNYAGFEQGVNNLERKQILSNQLKEIRLKEDLRTNKHFLEEQISFRKKQQKFEKNVDLNQAKQMNLVAQEELDKDVKRQEQRKVKRIEYTNELRTQIDHKDDPYSHMTEQERRMNKDKLEI